MQMNNYNYYWIRCLAVVAFLIGGVALANTPPPNCRNGTCDSGKTTRTVRRIVRSGAATAVASLVKF